MKYLPRDAAQVVSFAYPTGMRASEIFNLTWRKVDLPQKPIRLGTEDTKSSEAQGNRM
jgi:integrase